MVSRRISANYVYTGKPNEFFRNGILELDEQGCILNVLSNADNRELARTEFYNGVLVPGFVNAHAHIELSGLKNKLERNTGLAGFFEQINEKRNLITPESNKMAARQTVAGMLQNGIVAVGDVLNTSDTFEIKQEFQNRMYFHNFIEMIGLLSFIAEEIFQKGVALQKLFTSTSAASIVPHASYSVSRPLFELILSYAAQQKSILSIHHQESEEENKIVNNRSGKIAEIFKSRAYSLADLPQAYSVSEFLASKIDKQKTLLVHNTFSEAKDLLNFKRDTTFLVLCINSNLFIENEIPLVNELHASQIPICLGTDSLASNDTNSILDEIQTIMYYFPEFEFSEILSWATINGARALDISQRFGSFEKGKVPGVNLITDFDFQHKKPSKSSIIKRLV